MLFSCTNPYLWKIWFLRYGQKCSEMLILFYISIEQNDETAQSRTVPFQKNVFCLNKSPLKMIKNGFILS